MVLEVKIEKDGEYLIKNREVMSERMPNDIFCMCFLLEASLHAKNIEGESGVAKADR